MVRCLTKKMKASIIEQIVFNQKHFFTRIPCRFLVKFVSLMRIWHESEESLLKTLDADAAAGSKGTMVNILQLLQTFHFPFFVR